MVSAIRLPALKSLLERSALPALPHPRLRLPAPAQFLAAPARPLTAAPSTRPAAQLPIAALSTQPAAQLPISALSTQPAAAPSRAVSIPLETPRLESTP